MKTILFDLCNAQPINGSKFHGGGEYMKMIFNNLVIKYSDKIRIVTMYNYDKFIDDWLVCLIKDYNITTYDVKNLNDYLNIYYKEHINVFYNGVDGGGNYDTVKLPYNVLKITTIHGLRRVELVNDKYEKSFAKGLVNKIKISLKNIFPSYFKKRRIKQYEDAFNYYDKYITVSLHSMYAIKNYYPNIFKKGIKLFYPPLREYSLNFIGDCKYNDFVLMVSANRFEKNAFRGVLAYDELLTKNLIQSQLVVVGKLPKKLLKKIKNKDKIINLDYVAFDELNLLYKNCKFFYYPTLNEGFGYPPIEVMRYGKTCVVSNLCSLPELYGGAAYLCNPYDVEDIKNRLMMANENLLDEKIVLDRFKLINEKQKKDLDELCKYLFKETNEI